MTPARIREYLMTAMRAEPQGADSACVAYVHREYGVPVADAWAVLKTMPGKG